MALRISELRVQQQIPQTEPGFCIYRIQCRCATALHEILQMRSDEQDPSVQVQDTVHTKLIDANVMLRSLVFEQRLALQTSFI